MDYKEYLKSEHWIETRNEKILNSDNKCQVCGSKFNLNVHHNSYDNIGMELDSDMVVLCNECHALYHDKIDFFNKFNHKCVIIDFDCAIEICDQFEIENIEKFINKCINNSIDKSLCKTNKPDKIKKLIELKRAYKG